MAKNKPTRRPVAKGRIVMRTGEALVEDEAPWSAAEPEVVIGELDGPVGYAIANLLGDQTKGHSRVFAILNSDVQVRPATLMVSKVTVKSEKYTNILMGTVQAAIAHGVLDAVRAGDIPKKKANDLGIIVSVWLDPSIVEADYDPEILFRTNREATAKAIGKALRNEPSIDWLLANQAKVTHYFHDLAVKGEL
jgi:5,6,7,8-tetrahydromethanopterin hydro-lyase